MVSDVKPFRALKLEYIWLDGNKPQQLRSKIKIIRRENNDTIGEIVSKYRSGDIEAPIWNFDGSSTGQADTSKSELLIKPVNFYINPFVDPPTQDSILVLCEVYNTDMTPHNTNTRHDMVKTVKELDDATMYGYEQEFFIIDNDTQRPLGWPSNPISFPAPQGNYYCAAGANNVSGREFMDKLTDLLIRTGISVSGTNAEVALGQWEYQVGIVSATEGADQLWISRYIMHKLSEEFNYKIELDPKPYKGQDWNGSGMHVNFSTKNIRDNKSNKMAIAIDMCNKLEKLHKEHLEVYGVNNEHRLTGKNETSSMDKFGWGIGDRTKSIRIPSSITDKESIGYIEDRRPSSNGDPYLIVTRMLKTICC